VCKGHVKHSPAPVPGLYVPASHAVHVVPSNAPLYPAKHLQSVSASVPDAELVPSGHVKHSPAPVPALYLPASHAVHGTPPDKAVYPATHTQSVKSSLPAAELVCEGHEVQFPDPVTALNVPASHAAHPPPPAPVNPAEHWHSALPEEDSEFAGHASHAAVPTTLLNLPTSHALHSTPSDSAVYPAAHTQSVSSSLPSAELVCKGHVEHSPAPAAAL